MATKEFPLVPEQVPAVETKYRKITTAIPVPESISILETLRKCEPRSMGGQPPIVWDSGDDCTVSDAYGNTWLDFSAGVLVTSSGHGRKEICDAIKGMAEQKMYHAYGFATEVRAKLVKKICDFMPEPLSRVFLLTTGSEATECCIKLARTKGLSISPSKKIIVSFENDFHGRTMGAQLSGGSAGLKNWVDDDVNFVQVPFPEGFRQTDVSFDVFTKTLADKGVNPADVAGVIFETYQGCNATLFPKDYAQALRKWCDDNQVIMIADEVQACFGRTGKKFGFMHWDIDVDLVACGKGISGGMPCSAVLGTEELMSIYGPGEMTSTHSANPVCAAAALANIEVIEKENLVENAAKLESVLLEGSNKIAAASNGKVGHVAGKGLVSAIQFTKPGTTEPDSETAWEVVRRTVQKGVMLFAPVGVGGCCIKINPPMTITEDALIEGMAVIEEVVKEVCAD